MRMTISILVALLFVFSQCGSKNSSESNSIRVTPYILDNVPKTEKTYNTDEMRESLNILKYVGKLKDTINFHEFSIYHDGIYLDFNNYNKSFVKKTGLEAFVASNQTLTIDLENFSPPPPPIFIDKIDFEIDSIASAESAKKWEERPRNYIQSIPVLILNPTNDTVYLDQQGRRITMIQEAKNKKGEWHPIEYWKGSSCGNIYGAVGLLPKNLAVIKVIKYTGSFETEIRIKLKSGKHTVYSDPFIGSISKQQFKIPANINEAILSGRVDSNEYLSRLFLNY